MDDSDEYLFGDVDVTQAINPSLIQRVGKLHRQEARGNSPRPMSSPPSLDPYCPVVEPTCAVGSHRADWRESRSRPADKQVRYLERSYLFALSTRERTVIVPDEDHQSVVETLYNKFNFSLVDSANK